MTDSPAAAGIYASPSKSPVTEPFSKTARMVLASSGAMDKTVSWGNASAR
ncbi:hypothetical protein BZL29_2718 [Mycobacterium kansasii]|uniref:Uncharacterized protein n=1 Tax=Mycobacterium kansasii TaxID=1768 RepID=A0A1V3XL51_MYCKA|nr:hypothetical protein BZL29_2718 [Mycobacterium kansasii]